MRRGVLTLAVPIAGIPLLLGEPIRNRKRCYSSPDDGIDIISDTVARAEMSHVSITIEGIAQAFTGLMVNNQK